jgi:exopolysaccharide biosynthesis polyprenyl glycosylphosphotransferase
VAVTVVSRVADGTHAPPVAIAPTRRVHGRFWRDSLRRRVLALADATAVVFSAGVLWVSGATAEDAAAIVLFLPGWLLVAKACGLYDRDHRSIRCLTIDELGRIVGLALAGTALLATALLVLNVSELTASAELRVWVLVVASLFGFRAAARAIWRQVTPPERALILGEGPLADATRRKIELFPDIHVDVVAARESWSAEELRAHNELLGGVDRVIVASPTLDERLLAEVIAVTRARQVKLSVVPPVRGMLGTAVLLSHVADLPFVEYHTWDASRTTLFGKRVLDLVGSSVALVVLSPLLLVIAFAIRLSSSGPVLFVQQRAGRGGLPFRMLKFRTMEDGADDRLGEVVDIGHLEEPAFKLPDDPRVTSVGRLLRRTSLDELPQLVNVIRGEMSLVGPRPEQVEIVEHYTPEQRFRLSVKPGMTGPMQVYGRGALRFDERLAVERDYIENVSVGRDLHILALTIVPVLRRRGAY